MVLLVMPKSILVLLMGALSGCATTSTPTPATPTATFATAQYSGAVAALNAYCAAVGTTDSEIGPVCSDVLTAVNMTQPVAAAAINYIVSVLTKREARAAYDARETMCRIPAAQ